MKVSNEQLKLAADTVRCLDLSLTSAEIAAMEETVKAIQVEVLDK